MLHLGIDLLPVDPPLDFCEDLLCLQVAHAVTNDFIEVHLLIQGEVPMEFEGLGQLDEIVRLVYRVVVLLLLEPNDYDLLGLLLDGPPHKNHTVCEGIHSLLSAGEYQLVVLGIFNQHFLLNQVLESLVALMLVEGEVLNVFYEVGSVALNEVVLEDNQRQTYLKFVLIK